LVIEKNKSQGPNEHQTVLGMKQQAIWKVALDTRILFGLWNSFSDGEFVFFTINKMSYRQSGNPIISAGP
jgi:hypothetical protein